MTASLYPYAFGYCQVSDVTARIRQGAYNPDAPGEIGSQYIEGYVEQAAAQIDMVLARAGYTVPIVPLEGMIISAQVWSLLLTINATGAAGYVEMWRHAEDATGQDSQAERLLHLFDDLLARLEHGHDNLALFGVAGPFEPVADPALEMDSGANDFDASGVSPAPLFVIGGQQQTGVLPLTVW